MTLKKNEIDAVKNVVQFLNQETAFRLCDSRSGEVFVESAGLAPHPSIIIESRYNAWNYQTLLVMEGMRRLGRRKDFEAASEFEPNNIRFFSKHLPFFQALHKSGRMPKPNGETSTSRFGYYFEWDELWMTGWAPTWIDYGYRSGDSIFEDYTRRFMDFLNTCSRTDSGILANRETQVRTDDAYLMIPAMLRIAKHRSSSEMVDDAAHQMLGFYRRLFQKKDGLYFHIWDSANGLFAPAYWGRGNSWMALAFVDVLGHLSHSHRDYQNIANAFLEQMNGVKKWQAQDGGWRQVIDQETSWSDTSCSGMFTFALGWGLRNKILDPSFSPVAKKGWEFLLGQVNASGKIGNTCPSTGPGDLDHYLHRPRLMDDIHAYGPFLLAASEMLEG